MTRSFIEREIASKQEEEKNKNETPKERETMSPDNKLERGKDIGGREIEFGGREI